MVLSKINSNISYPELKKMYKEDSNMEANLYEITLHDMNIIIVVGNPKNEFKEQGILYFPIYLVKKNNKVTQIGVYEILQNNLTKYLDSEDDVDVEKMGEPLIYQFVTKKMLLKKALVPESETKKATSMDSNTNNKDLENKGDEMLDDEILDDEILDEDNKNQDNQNDISQNVENDIVISPNREDIFIMTKGVAIPNTLKEETKSNAKSIREKYKESKEDIWVTKIMKNNNYDLIDNEGDGDCLFATIRDAFSQIAQQTSVAKLRKKLSGEVTDDIFANYKNMYDMYNNALIKDTKDIKDLEKHYLDIKSKFNDLLDRNEQKQLVENAKVVKAQHDNLVLEKKVTAELLKEFKFMKGVDTIDKFKQIIKTCQFWAETWAISTLERILNIKFILLSQEAYTSKDFDNILQCGQLNDSILENKGEFMPDFYIILDYSGSHYKLVSYKKKQIFTFSEIPYDIKKLVVEKCMEKNAGVFSLIPDFNRFKYNLYPNNNTSKDEPTYEELTESKLRNLYDDDIVFQFYPKSSAKPLPGKGSGEKIPSDIVKEFTALATIHDWRKKLSDYWIQPFTLDNHQWASVEHYYQASKFKKNKTPSFYLSFSLGSGTDMSKDANMAHGAGGKDGKYKGKLIRPKEIQIDPDFFGSRCKKELDDARYAKFTQNKDLSKLLMATRNAKLQHHKRKQEPEVYEGLMLIRDKIKKDM